MLGADAITAAAQKTTAALVPSRPPQTKTNFCTTHTFFSDLTCFFAMGLAVVNSEH